MVEIRFAVPCILIVHIMSAFVTATNQKAFPMNRNIRIGLLLSCVIALVFFAVTRVMGQAKPATQTKAVKLGKLWDGHKVWSNPIVIIDGA